MRSQHRRRTPLIRLLARLGRQRDPEHAEPAPPHSPAPPGHPPAEREVVRVEPITRPTVPGLRARHQGPGP